MYIVHTCIHTCMCYTYIHPLGVCNLSRIDGDVGGERAKETGKVNVVCAPTVSVHVTETEHGNEL